MAVVNNTNIIRTRWYFLCNKDAFICSEVPDIRSVSISWIFFCILINTRFKLVCLISVLKMEISSDVYKSLVFVFILLTVHFLLMTANGEVTTAMTACSPENPDCYFERFANFKIPQVEPVKASTGAKPGIACFSRTVNQYKTNCTSLLYCNINRKLVSYRSNRESRM